MNLEFWVYTLWGKKKEYNWETDCEELVDTDLDSVVVNDPSDNLCIGGYRLDGKYLQYDSAEAWPADSYFRGKTNNEMHVTSTKYVIPLKDLAKYKVLA
jgi:hypothetical protein